MRVYAAFFSGALVVDAPDLDGLDEVELEAISGAETVVPVGFDDPDLEWRLSVLRSGMLNPGGGVDLFDGTRLVAFYGNPAGPALGVLGEQGPEATLDRLLSVAAEYEADGLQAVPTFEIITTVASSEAGADGDYSSEMTIATLQPWVDVAAEAGVYVLLDLQSGRRGDSHHQAARRALPLVHTRRRRVGGT